MSVNKVILVGNVGKDPEIRYVESRPIATFSLATTDRAYTTASGAQVPERTEWHRVLLWRKLAEVVEKYVHTGDKLYIEGELRSRSFTDKQGRTHNVTEIWASNMEMLSAKPQSAQQAEQTAPPAPEKCPF